MRNIFTTYRYNEEIPIEFVLFEIQSSVKKNIVLHFSGWFENFANQEMQSKKYNEFFFKRSLSRLPIIIDYIIQNSKKKIQARIPGNSKLGIV